MHNKDSAHRDYSRVEQALHYVAANFQTQPDLAAIAESVNLSEAHFQRLFKRWAGVSPKQFLQYLTLEHARLCLSDDMSVLDTTFDSGLAAPARLNELFIRLEAITPAEFRQKGKGIDIAYGFHETPFGLCLIGVTDRGLCGLEFCTQSTEQLPPEQLPTEHLPTEHLPTEHLNKEISAEASKERTLKAMADRLPAANYHPDQERTAEYRDLIFASDEGSVKNTVPLLVRGTQFQIKVWEALLRIPTGARVSYKKLASAVGSPGASRAVGSAVGKNPVAILIPCHRVIREDGMLGGYHWGLERKLALLGAESIGRNTILESRNGPQCAIN